MADDKARAAQPAVEIRHLKFLLRTFDVYEILITIFNLNYELQTTFLVEHANSHVLALSNRQIVNSWCAAQCAKQRRTLPISHIISHHEI